LHSKTELAYSGEWESRKVESVEVLFWERPLVLFLGCAVMFHFANAAMLPLLGEVVTTRADMNIIELRP
jgi:hypothetical protein